MGNARVIFVGAVSAVIGLYSVGITRSERLVQRVAEVHAYQAQAEEIAKSGIALAINKMGNSKPSKLPRLSKLSIFDGTMSYDVNDDGLSSKEARITANGIYKGHSVVRVAIVRLTSSGKVSKKKKWSNWEIVKVYSRFEETNFSDQYLEYYREEELG